MSDTGTANPGGTGDHGVPVLIEPGDLADAVGGLLRPWLFGIDVDGTLAPIVARPEDAELVPDALVALDELAARVGVMVAVVSGRPLADLRDKFALPSSVMLLGSHGAEVGTHAASLTTAEEGLMRDVVARFEAVVAGLPGSWIEHKPLAVALHVRQAEVEPAERAFAELDAELLPLPTLTIHRGHMVFEVAVRSTSKVDAFTQLRQRLEPLTTVFIGDDQSDERVFASLGETDRSIKVGDGPSSASYRLPSPAHVVEFLLALARQG